MDPEKVHDRAISWGKFFGKTALRRSFLSLLFGYRNKALEQNILGIRFKNPVGLAAGFDKNAEITQIMEPLGFGFEEVGSITGEPCKGNPKPRLWRLIKSRAIIVWYGLKNDGAKAIHDRLRNLTFNTPLGISVAKTNSPETVDIKAGTDDYVKAFKTFLDIGDYFTINISCPNAFGGEPFCGAINLSVLLSELDKIETKKPVFLKLPPDLAEKELDDIIDLSRKHKVQGFVISNLTKDKNKLKVDAKEMEEIYQGKGGISGKAVEELANKAIEYVYRKTRGEFIIMGCGGIFSAKDAYKKIKLGSSLVQLITGMIFEGPQLIGQINYDLVKLLEKDGYKNISEAVGADLK